MPQLLWSCNEDAFSVDIFACQLDVCGGGEGGKAVDASAGYFLDKSQLIHFHKFYVKCRKGACDIILEKAAAIVNFTL